MAIEQTERLLGEIGRLLADDNEYPLDGTLLYARLDHNWVAPSIYKDRGNHLVYRWPDLNQLGGALLNLWNAQDADDRWAEIEYMVRDGRFTATYTYPDDIDPEEDESERRDRIVRRHFGDKPIEYPPLPSDDAPPYEV